MRAYNYRVDAFTFKQHSRWWDNLKYAWSLTMCVYIYMNLLRTCIPLYRHGNRQKDKLCLWKLHVELIKYGMDAFRVYGNYTSSMLNLSNMAWMHASWFMEIILVVINKSLTLNRRSTLCHWPRTLECGCFDWPRLHCHIKFLSIAIQNSIAI